MPDYLRRGDFVTVTFEQTTRRAFVAIASRNAESLVVMFEGIVGGYVGMMPIAWDPVGRRYVDLINGREVTIDRDAQPDAE